MSSGQMFLAPAGDGLVGLVVGEPDPPAAPVSLGLRSLKEMVEAAVAEAEGQAIRRALRAARGNKSQAARFLRTNYTTLHIKMRRYGISASEFLASEAEAR